MGVTEVTCKGAKLMNMSLIYADMLTIPKRGTWYAFVDRVFRE